MSDRYRYRYRHVYILGIITTQGCEERDRAGCNGSLGDQSWDEIDGSEGDEVGGGGE